MLNVKRGVGRSGSAILILTGLIAVPAAAVEVRVPVPQVHITVPPPVHTLTPQLHTVTPTVKGNVLNAVKGLQQNTLNSAKGRGTISGVVINKNVTGPNFKTTNNPDGNTSIRFGDGAQGQTLPIGSNNIKAGAYRQGDEGSIGDTAAKTFDGTTTSGGTIPSSPRTGQLYLRFQFRTVAVGRIGWASGGTASGAPFSFNKIDPTGKASVVSLINPSGSQTPSGGDIVEVGVSPRQLNLIRNSMQNKLDSLNDLSDQY
jgi:hypothetical protein